METPLNTGEKEHAVEVLRGLDRMRREKIDCDLIIKVDKEEIPVHKNVLRAQSEYFDAMFTHDTLENQSGVVEMKEMKFKPVKKCIDFFYTGKISTSEEGCEDLLHTASLMQVKPVCDKIAPFLQSRLSSESFFKIKKIAAKFDLENLNKVCDDFAIENLTSLVKKEEFNHFEKEYIIFLTKSQHGEDGKLATILQWVKADTEKRRDALMEMVSLIDHSKISPSYGKYLVENEPLCSESPQLMKYLFFAVVNKFNVVAAPAELPNPRSSEKGCNAILVFDLSSKALQVYRPSARSWTRMHDLHDDMEVGHCFTSVAVKNWLFVLMGQKVYKINIRDKNSKWQRMGDMRVDHSFFIQAVTHDDSLYVTGAGRIEKFDLKQNVWDDIDSSCAPNGNSLVRHGDYVFSIGGEQNGVVKTVNKFSLASKTWSAVKAMRVARRTPAAAVLDDKIYIAGGYVKTALSDVECFEIKSEIWTKVASMTQCRFRFGLCAIGGKLFAVGNFRDACSIESYDKESDSWNVISNEPTMKIMAQATTAIRLPE